MLDNLADHMVGTVYVKFFDEEDAAAALEALNGRWYSGRQVAAEYSPVTDFRIGGCRQFEETVCTRRGLCNYLHLKPIPRELLADLVTHQPKKGTSHGGREALARGTYGTSSAGSFRRGPPGGGFRGGPPGGGFRGGPGGGGGGGYRGGGGYDDRDRGRDYRRDDRDRGRYDDRDRGAGGARRDRSSSRERR